MSTTTPTAMNEPTRVKNRVANSLIRVILTPSSVSQMMFHIGSLVAHNTTECIQNDRPCVLDSVPTEVLEYIFVLACIDGGFTGRSLSRVSKHIREISRVARFHSVSLRSGRLDQVGQFLSLLSAERARPCNSTPRVRHLFLSSAQRSKKWKPLRMAPSTGGVFFASVRIFSDYKSTT